MQQYNNLPKMSKKVTSALIGASRLSQIEENVKAIENLDFTSLELNKIAEVLKEE